MWTKDRYWAVQRIGSVDWLLAGAGFLLVQLLTCGTSLAGGGGFWTPLIERLAAKGEDRAELERLFSRQEVTFEERIMPLKVVPGKRKPDYSKFLQPARLQRAYRFLKENYDLLHEVERRYGVPKEVKVAILLVETDFGRYIGNKRAFNVLASMARVTSARDIDRWIPPEIKRDPARMRRLNTRLKKKSRWAFKELQALLRYCRENHMDPLAIRGSIFGAIGYCQFMPSNIFIFGQDGDGDGRIDLFTMEDALASMANYLKKTGWREGLNRSQQERVILKYNHSRPYARTVIEVAKRLKEMERRDSSDRVSL